MLPPSSHTTGRTVSGGAVPALPGAPTKRADSLMEPAHLVGEVLRLSQNHQQVPLINLVAFFEKDFLDHAVFFGFDVGFHLHCFG